MRSGVVCHIDNSSALLADHDRLLMHLNICKQLKFWVIQGMNKFLL